MMMTTTSQVMKTVIPTGDLIFGWHPRWRRSSDPQNWDRWKEYHRPWAQKKRSDQGYKWKIILGHTGSHPEKNSGRRRPRRRPLGTFPLWWRWSRIDETPFHEETVCTWPQEARWPSSPWYEKRPQVTVPDRQWGIRYRPSYCPTMMVDTRNSMGLTKDYAGDNYKVWTLWTPTEDCPNVMYFESWQKLVIRTVTKRHHFKENMTIFQNTKNKLEVKSRGLRWRCDSKIKDIGLATKLHTQQWECWYYGQPYKGTYH